jgi:tRNA pseudouridine55 synthase
MDGLILVDKPPGWSSHDVVVRLRNVLEEKGVGHFGTLDPLATGLLLVAVGRATRLFPFFSRTDKSYRGRIRLGYATDTYDAQGRAAAEESHDLPDEQKLRATLASLTGVILQTPPPFSAKKIHGRPSYALARQHKAIPLPPEHVTVHFFTLDRYDPPCFDFRTRCSAGTYVRSLAHDLGRALGCGAHLQSLCRLSSGEFSLEQALNLDEIEDLAKRGEILRFLRPMESLLPDFPKLVLSELGCRLVKNGRPISAQDLEPGTSWPSFAARTYRLFGQEGRLMGLARPAADGRSLHPFLVLP